MQTPAEERVRELEAELAAAKAEIRELEKLVETLGGTPQQNAHVEGADADDAG
jgi:uncharacterized coiled-coil protein SlyX